MLLLAICAATDQQKNPAPLGPTSRGPVHAPPERVLIAVFVAMLGISVSIGAQTG